MADAVDDEQNSPMTVFDLPQLHSKPPAATLLHLLSRLAIDPSSFSGNRAESSLNISERGLTGYLTRFISSPLTWITSDKHREEIWASASQRLSERSGRMAMASISRTFSICDFAVKRDGKAPRYVHIKLNEPSMTNDNVGHKTWAGSFLLAKRLPHMMIKHFPTLLLPPTPKGSPPTSHMTSESLRPTAYSASDAAPEFVHLLSPPASPVTPFPLVSRSAPDLSPYTLSHPPVSVLELGAGTGLTGIAAAALFSNASVNLTDLPSIVPNLVANIESNSHLFFLAPRATILDWSKLPSCIDENEKYDCILAGDSLYDPHHPDWLTNAMTLFLKRQPGARLILELPFRDMDLPYHDLLREELVKKGFIILEEGEEMGWDDWEGAWCEKMAVKCWWSIWGWAERVLEETSKEKGKKQENEKLGKKEDEQELEEETEILAGSADSIEDDCLHHKHHDNMESRAWKRSQRQQQICPLTEQPSHEHILTTKAAVKEEGDQLTNSVACRVHDNKSIIKVNIQGRTLAPHLRGFGP